jgi:hypothetical protein
MTARSASLGSVGRGMRRVLLEAIDRRRPSKRSSSGLRQRYSVSSRADRVLDYIITSITYRTR